MRQSNLSPRSYGRRRSGQWRIPSTQKYKAYAWRFLIADAAVWRLAGILRLPWITLLVQVGSKKKRDDEHFMPCRTWCVASFADCRGIPAAIFFTPVRSAKESANAGLNQRPLWDNDSRHSAYCCKRSDQWAICSAQSWYLNKLEFGRRLGKPSAILRESRCLFGSELRIGRIVFAGTAHACPT